MLPYLLLSHPLTFFFNALLLTVVLFATTLTNSVVGSMYGCTLFLTMVLCSKAYPKPMSVASLHAGPRKERPKLRRWSDGVGEGNGGGIAYGMLGPVSTSVPRMFRTTVSLAG